MIAVATAPRPHPKVACVIVTYNGEPWLEQCLQSLEQSSLKAEVIVIDNASTDRTVAIAREHPLVRVVETGANLGFGRANNIGMAMALDAAADFVFILNQDAHIATDALEVLCREAELHPDLGILSPMQLTGEANAIDSTFLQHYLAPYAPALLGDSVLGQPLQSHYKLTAAPAAAWMFPRKFLLEVGGFDPLFFMYCEDDDLCSRALHHGWFIAVVPSAKFFHCRGFHGQTQGQSASRRFRRRRSRMRSMLVRQIKMPSTLPLRAAWQSLWKMNLNGLASLVAHLDWVEALAAWAAAMQVVVEIPTIAEHRKICMSRGSHWLSKATLPN